MQTPITIAGEVPESLEDVRPGEWVFYVTAAAPGVEALPPGPRLPLIRWPATVLRFCSDRPDGPLDLRVYTHAGIFLIAAVPYDETQGGHSWHMPAHH